MLFIVICFICNLLSYKNVKVEEILEIHQIDNKLLLNWLKYNLPTLYAK